MWSDCFLKLWLPVLCLAACCTGCAYSNVTRDADRHPVVNTGVGATILYPGQGPTMPPVHPGYQLPGAAPEPGDPGARGPHGQPVPVARGTIGGTPTTTAQQGQGSSTTSSGNGGVSFIGGSEVDEDTFRKVTQEPRWLKYLLAPFAIAAYPFKAAYNAATRDDGPPPAPLAPHEAAPQVPPPAPVDVQTQYEQSQLEALERELGGQPSSQPAVSAPASPPLIRRPAPTGNSISAELAALQRGIAPKIPGEPETAQQMSSGSAAPQPSPVQQPSSTGAVQSNEAEWPPSSAPQTGKSSQRGGIADQVTDRDGDGRPDHWIYHHGGQTVRELFDEDADGAPDRYVFYQAETGEKSREEEDTNLDGQVDSWLEYQSGEVARHRRDTNGDGFLDTWSFYRAGELARQERDLNADGFRDRVGFYRNGRLAREEDDRNGDGRPDRVTLFDEEERILQRDEDRNGDGVVDLRSFYSEGRLIRRELLDEDVEESIEEDELASAAWSSGEEAE